jgi:hypothetical protein
MSYLRFVEQPKVGKTRIVSVLGSDNYLLGTIRWYCSWLADEVL